MPSEPKRLLFFEDDYENLRDLREYLESDLGWKIKVTAAEGTLERLGREAFDLIVVDLMIRSESLDAEGNSVRNVHFPGVSWLRTGLEFLRRLRSGEFVTTPGQGTSPDVPVIVLSAVANYSVEDALPEGSASTEYVEKPFMVGDLIARIERLVQE
jgi:CheY-like chemotaxis protein